MQKKIQLDVEHKARKARRPAAQTKPSSPPPSSSRHSRRSAGDAEADAASEHITLDDMFVIDSAGEYSVSGDDDGEVAADAGDGRAAASKRDHPASSDAHRLEEFQLFLSYLRSVDCKFQKAVST